MGTRTLCGQARIKGRLVEEGRWEAYRWWHRMERERKNLSTALAHIEAEKAFPALKRGEIWDGRTPCDNEGAIYDRSGVVDHCCPSKSPKLAALKAEQRRVRPEGGVPAAVPAVAGEGQTATGNGSGAVAAAEGAVTGSIWAGKRKTTTKEDVEWVAAHLVISDVKAEESISPTAWGLYLWASSSAANRTEFYKSFWAKLLPTKAELGQTDSGDDDGRNVDRLLGLLTGRSGDLSGEHDSDISAVDGGEDAVQRAGSEDAGGESGVPTPGDLLGEEE